MLFINPESLQVCRKFQRSKFIIEKGYHKNDTLIFVLDGSFSLQINGETFTVCQNQGFLFPKNVYFEREILGTLTLLFAEFTSDEPILPVFLSFTDEERLNSSIRLLLSAIREERGNKLLAHYLSDIFCQAYMENLHPKKRYSQDVEAFFQYVEENLKNKICIEEFCKSVNLTHTGFILKFKKEYGQAPSAYIHKARMKLASELLLDSDWSVLEIALECGFENQYYFSNYFKKFSGVSPTSYRKAHSI